MRAAIEIVGVILVINGIGGLWNDDFGLLSRFADGAALTTLHIGAAAVGAALIGGSLLGRKNAKQRQGGTAKSDDWAEG
ncbi:hypothetical protein FHS23_002416 [Prauserella isguenensis]|uniref:Uncharacterized protein n=1 Tax=Prauserella isguenensis TaxID=1470180 RepID=A0A839S248_9PSEU|nr:hypothetical protein [Prauserella isguenensis]MBB3051393.1 hypothetical protein [Prauserella isguenensis]